MISIDDFIAEVSQSSYGWPESLLFTYEKTRALLDEGISGDLVECGVGNGVHPAAMARACIDAGQDRCVRLFDSFEGVPHGGPSDVEWNRAYGDGSGRLERTGVAAHSTMDVRTNLDRWQPYANYFFHLGWFQVSAEWHARDPSVNGIAFLRLDGDLHDSTLVCLQHLYPLVSPGGIVVVDDMNLDGCRQAVHDYFEGDPPASALITASGDVWWRKQQ